MNAPRDWTLLCLSCGAVVALHDFFLVPGYLFLDLDLGTWVPGHLGAWVLTWVNVTRYLVI